MKCCHPRVGSILAAAFLPALFARPVAASDWNVTAGAGACIPIGTGAIQEGVSTGPTASAAVYFALGHGIELGGRFAISHFPRDDDGVLRKSSIEQRPLRIVEMSGGSLRWTQGQVDLRFFPAQGRNDGAIHPFLLGTTGLAVVNLEAAEFSYAYAGHTWSDGIPGSQESHFALGIGAGIRFDLGHRFRLVAEGRYEVAFRQDETLRGVPLRLETGIGW